jgi:hypothetical protein
MRYKANYENVSSYQSKPTTYSSASSYVANNSSGVVASNVGSSNSNSFAGPMKANGTPDMRYKANWN